MTIYPLGHNHSELQRLDVQARLLHDPVLNELAAKSISCLEIGCGSGSNFPLLQQANPGIGYTGIDISSQAIQAAKLQFHHRAEFYVMNGDDIQLDKKFDLIFTKLVLWSVGPSLSKILSEVRRCLTPGGMFYALEPCNQLIQLHPPKPYTSAWIKAWDEAAMQQGLNPWIGTSVASELMDAGFNNVACRFVPVTALGINRREYLDVIENMKGFFMGPAAEKFGLEKYHHLSRDKAVAELDNVTPGSLVMDAVFAAWGSV